LSKNEKKTIQSVDRAFDIIRCFNDNEELGITEISKKLNIHKSTVFGLASTLEANDILEKNNYNGKYRLGIELYRLSTRVNVSLKKLVFPYLEKLVSLYQETANLVILKDISVMYLEKVEGSYSMRISTLIGGEKPIYCTAVGKSILAFLNEKDLEKTVGRLTLDKYTENTIVDKNILIKDLDEIRVKGYAEDHEEMEIGLHCIAAPILNQYKTPIASISVSGPASRMNVAICKEIGDILVKLANEISQKLGNL